MPLKQQQPVRPKLEVVHRAQGLRPLDLRGQCLQHLQVLQVKHSLPRVPLDRLVQRLSPTFSHGLVL